MRVLSFHMLIESDYNRVFSGNRPSAEDIEAIKAADAVILPQGCREILYRTARQYCDHVFPNYDVFFDYPGKTGQAALFKEMGVPHPRTFAFGGLQQFYKFECPFSFPFVFKFCWGGEGKNVFLLESADDLNQRLAMAVDLEKEGKES